MIFFCLVGVIGGTVSWLWHGSTWGRTLAVPLTSCCSPLSNSGRSHKVPLLPGMGSRSGSWRDAVDFASPASTSWGCDCGLGFSLQHSECQCRAGMNLAQGLRCVWVDVGGVDAEPCQAVGSPFIYLTLFLLEKALHDVWARQQGKSGWIQA